MKLRKSSNQVKGGPQRKNFAFPRVGLTVLISVLVIYGVVSAGTITPPSGTPSAQFYTLSEIYNFITANTTATEGSHSFTFSDSLAGAGRTLTEIYNALASLISADKVKLGTTYLNVAGTLIPSGGNATTSDVLIGKTYFGDSQTDWILQTGAMADNGAFTLTASSTNQSVIAGYYSGGTLAGDADLASGNIKSGINIFGIVGAYPSVAYPLSGDTASNDAAVGNILSGFEAWTKTGSLLTGIIPTRILSNANDTVSAGYYGTTTLSAVDTDLAVGNILSGATIFGFSGTVVAAPDWSLQKNVRWDDWQNGAGTTGEYTGEEAVWSQTDAGGDAVKSVTDNSVTVSLASNAVWRDTRTGLYWSDRTATTIDNEFNVSACNFTATGDANDDPACDNYDPSDAYAEDNDVSANEFCLNLGLDADNNSTLETDWRLPSQKELMQAYINGSANNLPNPDSYFWSATENRSNAAHAWDVYLNHGYTNYNTKANNYYVRCVRP